MKTINRESGFTLIELMITVAIAAIILTLAVPSFRTAILNNTRTSVVNEFLGVLNLARSEAIKRGIKVEICRSSDGSSCASDNTGIWEDGWIVWSDQNNSGALDANEIIRIYSKSSNGFTLRTSTNLTQWIAYLPSGVSTGDNGLGTGTFRLCDSRGVDEARFIVISMTGRSRVRTKESSDTCP